MVLRQLIALAEISTEFFGICDMALMPIYSNAAARRMVGLADAEQVRRTPIRDFFFPEDVAFITDEFFPRVLREGLGKTEIRFRHFITGEAVWVVYSLVVLKDETGRAVGLGTVTHDITERKRIEAALRDSEARERALFAASPTPFLVMEADTPRFTISTANDAYLAATLTTREGLIGRGVFEAFPDTVADPTGPRIIDLRASLEQVLATRSPHVLPLLKYDIAGPGDSIEERWWRLVNSPVLDEHGKVEAIIHSATDITERRNSEAALRASEERHRTMFDGIDATFCIVEMKFDDAGRPVDYRYIDVNPAFVKYTGLTDAIGRWVSELVPGHEQFWYDTFGEVALTGRHMRFERSVGAPARHYQIYAFRVGAPEQRRVAALLNDITVGHRAEVALRDLNATLADKVAAAVTERETALAQLHELQKLETIGQLTGGVAHDFNNLLTPIVGTLDLVRRKLDGDERSQRLIVSAQQAAERARVLISRLLTFARRQHLEPRPVDVAEIARGMEDLVARSIGPQIVLELDIAGDLPSALVDPNQLELALLNLCVNARDAMPGGGRIIVAADVADAGEAEAPRLAPGPYVRLRVIDTGVGMDPETLRRAVEPFYSTKGVGKGTGLGLSMAHGLAAQSGGALQLRSSPGAGTTATIWLPLSDTTAVARGGAPDGEIARTRPVRLLLVDDEELVRTGTADMLADLGHTVEQAASGFAALDILKRGDIDLMVTDYAMPGMTGAELASAARLLHPDLPILVITGYADLPEDVERGMPRLAKPFRQAELAACIASLVEGTKAVAMPAREGLRPAG